jgi:alkanesulfonate monooxygenase SsuD/methylene tetrahydromethanopterin reductase-like flavin-dependent oxidoreductase (luciferase family)
LPTRCARKRETTEASKNFSRRPTPPKPWRSSAAAFWSIGSWSRPVRRSRFVDKLEEIHFASGANGGFILGRGYAAMDNIREFVELVVPELQRRGLSKRKYTGPTLRENLN